MEYVHAGYELHLFEEDRALIRAALHELLASTCDSSIISAIAQKAYNTRYIKEDNQTTSDFIVENLIDTRRRCIQSAQIHIKWPSVQSKDVQQWHDTTNRHQPEEIVYAYIKKMFVSFFDGVIAFVACINSKQVYVTFANNSKLTLQNVKRLFNSAQRHKSEFVIDFNLKVPISTYIQLK